MGTNVYCWCLDRRGIKGRDRQDQWHSSLLGALSIQGTKKSAVFASVYELNVVHRVPKIERSSNWSLKLKTWEAT